jgi:hypothetical protein
MRDKPIYSTDRAAPQVQPTPMTSKQALNTAAEMRRAAQHIRDHGGTYSRSREIARYESLADEMEQRAGTAQAVETRKQQFESDARAKLCHEHLESFRRTFPDHAPAAQQALEDQNIDEFWSVVRVAEADELAKLDKKRDDASLARDKADADHAKAELASAEARRRLESIP